MYEIQGWFNLAESTYEYDAGIAGGNIQMLKKVIEERFVWSSVKVELFVLNGKLGGHRRVTVVGP